jgi:cytochrome c oxidase subunit II
VRRRICIPLILFLVAGLASACGSDDDSTAAADRPDMPMQDMDDGHMDDAHGEASEVADGATEIAVTADDLAFDPDEITVQSGEDIAIVLTSVDILHDFTIDELDAHVAADRGETATGGFHAEEPGRYTFYCDVTGHREAGMEGTLVVES